MTSQNSTYQETLGVLRAYQQSPCGCSAFTGDTTSSSGDSDIRDHQHCTWCGGGGHLKNNCQDLTSAFRAGVVHTRRGKICVGKTGDGGDAIPYPHGEKTLRDWVLRKGKLSHETLEAYRMDYAREVLGQR